MWALLYSSFLKAKQIYWIHTKKLRFSKPPILKKNFQKFHGLVFGLVGLIDTKGMDPAGSTFIAVRLSDISTKTGKKCIFCVFRPFLSLCQSHRHIGWATSMLFASINRTNPWTNPWNYLGKRLRISDFKKLSFFDIAIWFFFASLAWKQLSEFIGWQGWVKILIKPNVTTLPNILHPSVPIFVS